MTWWISGQWNAVAYAEALFMDRPSTVWPMHLHLSVNSVSSRFTEPASAAQAVCSPSVFPQCIKQDEAAVCHVYGGSSAWQGVRHGLDSPSFVQAASPDTCASILLSHSFTAASVPPTALPPEIWFLIKSTVNGCSHSNNPERSHTLGSGAQRNCALVWPRGQEKC